MEEERVEEAPPEDLIKPKKAKHVTLPNSSPEVEDEGDGESKPLLGPPKKLPFPKSVFFIFLNEFCERYSFYGLEAVLSLFLRNVLNYTETASTVIYHLFVTVAFTMPFVGGIFGDSILGKFKTTVYFSIAHCIGSAALAVGALPYLTVSLGTLITIVALVVTAVGIGGIKPNVAAFGGDQFKLPEQSGQLTLYFSIYYVSINIGATLSEIFTPMLRKDVGCFGQETCYSLAFAVPAFLMILSLVAFVMGKKMYKIKPVTESVTLNTIECISYAIGNRKEMPEGTHWLDAASDKYSESFINDIKQLGGLILLLSPVTVFWCLWSQMGTTWTFQATRMNGYVSDSYAIKPDQIQVTNSFLIMFLVPIFDLAFYPLLAKISFLVKPINRISWGCFLMSLSFVVAGCLEIQLSKSNPVLPAADQQNLNIVNNLPCSLNVSIQPVFVETKLLVLNPESTLPSYTTILGEWENVLLYQIPAVDYNVTIQVEEGTRCSLDKVKGNELLFSPREFLPQPGEVQTFLISNDTSGSSGVIVLSQTHESLTKSDEGNAKCRIIGDIPQYSVYSVELTSPILANYSSAFSSKDQETLDFEVEPGKYNVSVRSNDPNVTFERVNLGEISLLTGGSYLLGILQSPVSKRISAHVYTLTEPNRIHMFWQLPQYGLLTLAEILVAITGYHFAYDQAPVSMKSTLQSVWLMTNAGGNLIVVFFVAFDIFPTQAILFFFFAGLMLVATWLFMYLGYNYVHWHPEAETEEVPLPPETPPSERRLPRRRTSIAETVATGVK